MSARRPSSDSGAHIRLPALSTLYPDPAPRRTQSFPLDLKERCVPCQVNGLACSVARPCPGCQFSGQDCSGAPVRAFGTVKDNQYSSNRSSQPPALPRVTEEKPQDTSVQAYLYRDAQTPIFERIQGAPILSPYLNDPSAIPSGNRSFGAPADNTLALGSNGPENWLICDLDSNIVHLSAMVSSHLQYPDRDLLGRTVPDLVHREDRPRFQEILSATISQVQRRSGMTQLVPAVLKNLSVSSLLGPMSGTIAYSSHFRLKSFGGIVPSRIKVYLGAALGADLAAGETYLVVVLESLPSPPQQNANPVMRKSQSAELAGRPSSSAQPAAFAYGQRSARTSPVAGTSSQAKFQLPGFSSFQQPPMYRPPSSSSSHSSLPTYRPAPSRQTSFSLY